ncbi:MAG: ferritin family protein [bacterium]
MADYSISEVLNFALKMEEHGEKFYEYAAENIKHKDLQKVFSALALEEKHHAAVFEKMLAETAHTKILRVGAADYVHYLARHIETKSVYKKKDFEAIKGKMKSITDVIVFAMDREINSVVYYSEMKKHLAEKNYAIFDKIINEEIKHFTKLEKAKKLIVK